MLQKNSLMFLLFCSLIVVNTHTSEQKSMLRRAVTLLALTATAPELFTATAWDPFRCSDMLINVFVTTTKKGRYYPWLSGNQTFISTAGSYDWKECLDAYNRVEDTASSREIFEQCIKKSQEDVIKNLTAICLPYTPYPGLCVPLSDDHFNKPYLAYLTRLASRVPIDPIERPIDMGRATIATRWLVPVDPDVCEPDTKRTQELAQALKRRSAFKPRTDRLQGGIAMRIFQEKTDA